MSPKKFWPTRNLASWALGTVGIGVGADGFGVGVGAASVGGVGSALGIQAASMVPAAPSTDPFRNSRLVIFQSLDALLFLPLILTSFFLSTSFERCPSSIAIRGSCEPRSGIGRKIGHRATRYLTDWETGYHPPSLIDLLRAAPTCYR